MKSRFIFFALIVWTWGAWAVQVEKKIDCTEDGAFKDSVQGKTAQECQASVAKARSRCNEMTIDSTMGQLMSTAAETSCVSKIMNTELDKRLLEIKKTSMTQFKDEMKLQKNFNNGMHKACDLLNSCNGTLARVSRQNCFLKMIQWRNQQALQVNSNSLSLSVPLKTDPAPDKRIAALSEVKEYAKLLCQMPADVFNNQKRPSNCQMIASAAFVKAAGDDCEDH